jgi:hypothetical protein
MEKVKSGITILLNTVTNCTFIADDLDEEIQTGARECDKNKIEWCGELNHPVSTFKYKQAAEVLWAMLDEIDTLSDDLKPNGLKSLEYFYKSVMEIQNKRHEILSTQNQLTFDYDGKLHLKGKFKCSKIVDGQEIAKKIIEAIIHDCGAANRWEEKKDITQWVLKISPYAYNFFIKLPEFDDETIEDIAIGEVGENEGKYGLIYGYNELRQVLEDFFNEFI